MHLSTIQNVSYTLKEIDIIILLALRGVNSSKTILFYHLKKTIFVLTDCSFVEGLNIIQLDRQLSFNLQMNIIQLF